MALIPWRSKQGDGGRTEGSPLATLRTEMDRLFDTYLREPWAAMEWPFGPERPWAPAIDVAETEDEVTVRAEIPGIDPKDLDVSVTGSELTFSGEKKETMEKKDKNFFRSETRYGSFRRSVTLPATVDPNQVEADYANGVVTIRLKKAQKTPAKRVEIKVK